MAAMPGLEMGPGVRPAVWSVSYTHLDVDEFCLQILRTYPRKDAEGKDGTVEFKNVNSCLLYTSRCV